VLGTKSDRPHGHCSLRWRCQAAQDRLVSNARSFPRSGAMHDRTASALLVAAGAAVWSVCGGSATLSSAAHHHRGALRGRCLFDTMARIIGARMGELLGQSVIVENVTGAGGIIGVQHVINAKPDGYTVLLGTVGTHAYLQSIYRKRRYDAVSDFTPVTLFSDQPIVLEGRKDLPANNLAEFIALLKQNGTKMQYGSAGVGSTTHLACALLNARDRRRGDPRSLSGWRACRERPDGRPHRLYVRQHRCLLWRVPPQSNRSPSRCCRASERR